MDTRTLSLVRAVWPIEGGSVVLDIATSDPLPAAVYPTLGALVTAVDELLISDLRAR